MAKARLCDHFDEQCRAIVGKLFSDVQHFPKGKVFLRENDDVSTVYLICSGWGARFNQMVDGGRQITELLLPGDLFPVETSMADTRNGDRIVALSDCHVSKCSPAALSEAAQNYAKLARTLWWMSQRDIAILRTWIAVNGQYKARARLAHLFCELTHRLEQVGIGTQHGYDLPLTQQELGEITGMTSVHANRTLKRMKHEGLIGLPRGRIDILHRQRLADIANFDSDYLRPA